MTMQETNIFIHYGATHFNQMRGFPVKNRPYNGKPNGGLWASRKEATYGWHQWVEEQGYSDDFNQIDSFSFTLDPAAHVHRISSQIDLYALPCRVKETNYIYGIEYLIDYEEAYRKGIDAIELCWFGDEYKDIHGSDLYEKMDVYGWSCDSIVILNPGIVCPIYKEEVP